MSCAKTAEPIEMPFVIWTRARSRKHGCLGGVHTETSTCRGDAACRQITFDHVLNAYYYYLNVLLHLRFALTVLSCGAQDDRHVLEHGKYVTAVAAVTDIHHCFDATVLSPVAMQRNNNEHLCK